MAALLTNLGISIHAPREGGDISCFDLFFDIIISIHAPREGGDLFYRDLTGHEVISIHAPREGGDLPAARDTRPTTTFQSTPPARGATCFG